jgi:threonyl-tRNA synthetase
MAKSYSLKEIRHSLAHLLGAAVLELYPGSKLAIGPAVDNGFYYDVEVKGTISDNDLPRIEVEMKKILRTWDKFEKIEETKESASKRYVGNPYKQELIDELVSKHETITSYKSGRFVDLCRGGHVDNAKDIKSDTFKLSHVAGAYWKGDEKNQQLTRIYGLAFNSKKELDDHIKLLQEAKKRDHKKLGIDLDLFTFSNLIGSGLPLFTPKGTLIRDILDSFVWELREKHGYQRVDIPHITKKDLYEKSGHWDKFKDELFKIKTREDHLFALKPMNCPHHVQVFDRKAWSYRELPQRYASTTKMYRDEQSGELGGIARVRSITVDDAHVFCRSAQAEDEILKVWDIVNEFYKTAGFALDVRLSLHDANNPDRYLGSEEIWKKTENQLRSAAKKKKIKFSEATGEAAFYGPKIDFVAKDSLGREWQVATIQLDMNLPERFDLTCVNEKGEKERIVMIHAAIMGSIERYMAILIEHYAGAFPIWLSPIQAIVLPISDKQSKWAEKVVEELRKNKIRVEIDDNSETLGKKIRQAEMQKVPYILIVGEKEVKAKTVAVRERGTGDTGQTKIDKFIKKIEEKINKKK